MNTFLWSVRRELWESKVVWIAPSICAAIIIGSVLVAAFGSTHMVIDGEDLGKLHDVSAQLTPDRVEALASMVLGAISLPFLITALFSQFFYTLESLYGERRDRSILFWKSLPVSDAATVLSKLFLASVAIPLAAVAGAILTELVVFAIASARLSDVALLSGQLWSAAAWGSTLTVIGYVLAGSMLWYLPVIGWLLLVSAWAPRSPFVWATLPPLALGLAEYIVFRSHVVLQLVGERIGLAGLMAHAFGLHRSAGFSFAIVIDKGTLQVPRSFASMMQAGEFFGSASLWGGVAAGAALVAAAVYVRRYRDASA